MQGCVMGLLGVAAPSTQVTCFTSPTGPRCRGRGPHLISVARWSCAPRPAGPPGSSPSGFPPESTPGSDRGRPGADPCPAWSHTHLMRPASSMASRQVSRPSATTPVWWLCPKAQASRSFSVTCSGRRPSSCRQPSAPVAVPLSGVAEPLPLGGKAGGRVIPGVKGSLVPYSAVASRKAQARKARARSMMTWTGAFTADEQKL